MLRLKCREFLAKLIPRFRLLDSEPTMPSMLESTFKKTRMALSRAQYLRQIGAVKQTPVDPLHLKFSEFRVPLCVIRTGEYY